MKSGRIDSILAGCVAALRRFPLTVIAIAAATVLDIIKLSYTPFSTYQRDQLVSTLLIGAAIAVVLQILYEHFGKNRMQRLIFVGMSVPLAILYYFYVQKADLVWDQKTVQTMTLYFILVWAFLWIPAIRSRFTLKDTIMASFRGFCMAFLSSLILFTGLFIISAATDALFSGPLIEYSHLFSFISLFYAPFHFIFLIPKYREEEDRIPAAPDSSSAVEEDLMKQPSSGSRTALWEVTKFLDNLISYIVIPLTAVFTVILLIYVIVNITGRFWTNNKMEVLLVSYSITVITIYLLAGKLENTIAQIFRRVFPKILLPVVLLQTIASILAIGEKGITYGRYYVILFGLFAIAASIIFGFLPGHRIGLIAPILIVLSLAALIRPIDAFTVSRANQAGRLKKVLERNDMLSGNRIKPSANLSEKDKEIIRNSVRYLESFEYLDHYPWLKDYNEQNFNHVFGFKPYEGQYPDDKENSYRSYSLNRAGAVPIQGHDYVIGVQISSTERGGQVIETFALEGKEYVLEYEAASEYLILKGDGTEVARLNLKIFIQQLSSGSLDELSLAEATFWGESGSVLMTLIMNHVNLYGREGEPFSMDGSGYLMITLR